MNRPTIKEQLIAERDKLLKEADALRNQVRGIDFAIETLRDEESRVKKGN